MAAKTDAYRTVVLNIARGTNSTVAPAALYLALYSALSSDGSSGGTEIAAATRQPITLTAPSTGEVVNSSQIIYPQATSDWGSVVGSGLWSSSGTSGYCFYTDVASSSITISSSEQLTISSGGWVLDEI